MTESEDLLEGDRSIPELDSGGGVAKKAILITGMVVLAAVLLYFAWQSEAESTIEPSIVAADKEKEYERKIKPVEVPPLPIKKPIVSEIFSAMPDIETPAEKADKAAREAIRARRRAGGLLVGNAASTESSASTPQASQGADPTAALNMAMERIQKLKDGPTESDMSTLADRLEESSTPNVTASYLPNRDYLVAQGTTVSANLETAISSDLPGMTRAIISEPLYSEDGANVLVPSGSRVVGQYASGMQQGEARIFVTWNRIITPQGIDVRLDSPGIGELGRAGHGGWIDSHFLERFGSSILLSLIGDSIDDSDGSEISQNASDNLNNSAAIALENSINIAPTLHKNQGDRIKIFVARDINFRPVYQLLNGGKL